MMMSMMLMMSMMMMMIVICYDDVDDDDDDDGDDGHDGDDDGHDGHDDGHDGHHDGHDGHDKHGSDTTATTTTTTRIYLAQPLDEGSFYVELPNEPMGFNERYLVVTIHSGDSWMYPYQRSRMGNPYTSPIYPYIVGVYGLLSPRIPI